MAHLVMITTTDSAAATSARVHAAHRRVRLLDAVLDRALDGHLLATC
ncbi:hypothetical protein [Actinokineospora sp.]